MVGTLFKSRVGWAENSAASSLYFQERTFLGTTTMSRNFAAGNTVRSIAIVALALFASTPIEAGDRYAFLVGVREYDPEELTSLRYTDNDITQLASVLAGSGYKRQNVTLMTQAVGSARTRYLPLAANIRKELVLVLNELAEDDSVIVAFAGHGVQFKGETESWFCPADAVLKDRRTLVSMAGVYRALESCRARDKILLVDACRNDPLPDISRAGREVELDPVGGQPASEPPGSVLAFFSCSRGQKAFEDPGLEGGIFFHFLVKGLEGDADLDSDRAVDLAELQKFTVKNVQAYVRTKLGKSQVPELRGEMKGLSVVAQVSRPPVGSGGQPGPMPLPPPPPRVLSAEELRRMKLEDTARQLASARNQAKFYEGQLNQLGIDLIAAKKALAAIEEINKAKERQIAIHRQAKLSGFYPDGKAVLPSDRAKVQKEIDLLADEMRAADVENGKIQLLEGRIAAAQNALANANKRIQDLDRQERDLSSASITK
jgi:hypothetical protein